MTGREVVALIRQNLGAPWREESYRDTFKVGNPDSTVLGIATTVMVTYGMLKRANAQDVSVAQLQFLAALGGDRPNGLFFAGDLGQRIFQQPFSWKALGVDVRGRSSTLRINYRTSHQIRMQADRLLDPEVADVDGNVGSGIRRSRRSTGLRRRLSSPTAKGMRSRQSPHGSRHAARKAYSRTRWACSYDPTVSLIEPEGPSRRRVWSTKFSTNGWRPRADWFP